MIQLFLIVYVCLYVHVNGLRDGETREARLARRQQHPDYKRALSNINLQFIQEFLREKPLIQPTTERVLWSFDPSSLGEDIHFGWGWLLPSLTFLSFVIFLFTIFKKEQPPAQHIKISCTV